MGSVYFVNKLDKGVIQAPGEVELDSLRFHHTTRNVMQFKTYELSIFVIFHLTFLDHCGQWVPETMEREITDKGGLTLVIFLKPSNITIEG